jgi:hypothetical protein
MHIWIVAVLVTIAAVGAGWMLRAGSASADQKPEVEPSKSATRELRDRLLASAPSDFGIAPDGAVWGVLMETGYPKAVATLVALADEAPASP